jgi:hypothetical protein
LDDLRFETGQRAPALSQNYSLVKGDEENCYNISSSQSCRANWPGRDASFLFSQYLGGLQ